MLVLAKTAGVGRSRQPRVVLQAGAVVLRIVMLFIALLALVRLVFAPWRGTGAGSGLAGPSAMKITRLAVAALVVLALSACLTDERNENEGRPPPGDAFVIVHLTDDGMEFASQVSAGTISFEIENNGASEHGFAIEGPSVSERVESIAPLEREVLTVNLEPGTYEVYSPTADDRARGLEGTIEVTEPPASEAPAEQPGIGPSDDMDDIGDEGP